VLLKSAARIRVAQGGGRISVAASEREIEARAVISAVPWHAFGRIWDGDPPAALAHRSSTPPRRRACPL
jgi:hypothetical protein